jgi:predicted methyltransferase
MAARVLLAIPILYSVLTNISPAGAAVSDYVPHAVADPSRPANDKKPDPDRKPAEVLAWADVKPAKPSANTCPVVVIIRGF